MVHVDVVLYVFYPIEILSYRKGVSGYNATFFVQDTKHNQYFFDRFDMLIQITLLVGF